MDWKLNYNENILALIKKINGFRSFKSVQLYCFRAQNDNNEEEIVKIPGLQKNISAPSEPTTPKLLQSLSYISGRHCYRNIDEKRHVLKNTMKIAVNYN